MRVDVDKTDLAGLGSVTVGSVAAAREEKIIRQDRETRCLA